MRELQPPTPPHAPEAAAPQEQAPPAGKAPSPQRRFLSHFGVIALVGLGLLIPLFMVEDLVSERSSLYRRVVEDISHTWGGVQRIAGPVLLIPFNERQVTERTVRRENGHEEIIKDVQTALNYLVVLPETADFTVALDPQERQRGIYRSLVYTSTLNMRGVFTLPTREALNRVAPGLDSVDYSKACVIMGLSFPSALRTVGEFQWNGAALRAEPGTQPFTPLEAGYKIPVPLQEKTQQYVFQQELTLNGSEGMRFTPMGETTVISMSSSWPHPSFQGNVLPAQRDITPEGFTAQWRIPSLARTYPNLGVLRDFSRNFERFSVGVDLYASTTHYKLITRSVKYGVLFIGLTFLTLVVFEMGLRVRLHPVQYGLVGLAMVVFYLVLLSLSEHAAFFTSYAAATACIVLMIALYVGAAARSARQGAGIGVLLVGLYTLLYAILQMEDYALLMGTALVLTMLAALMVVSRHINREYV